MLRERIRRGFTLIELLIVIAIIAVLIGLLLSAVQSTRKSADVLRCQNNLNQLGKALNLFHENYGGFPKAGKRVNELSWHVYILPQIEQGNLFDLFPLAAGDYTDSDKLTLALNKVPIFLCPSSPIDRQLTTAPNHTNSSEFINGQMTFTTHYYGVIGPKGPNPATGADYIWTNTGSHGGFAEQGIFQRDTKATNTNLGPEPGFDHTSITDGSSNTFLVGEMSWSNPVTGTRYRTWIRGCDNDGVCAGSRNIVNAINSPSIALFNDISFGSTHIAGANFVMADGSVRMVKESIDLEVYRGLASRNGGEVKLD